MPCFLISMMYTSISSLDTLDLEKVARYKGYDCRRPEWPHVGKPSPADFGGTNPPRSLAEPERVGRKATGPSFDVGQLGCQVNKAPQTRPFSYIFEKGFLFMVTGWSKLNLTRILSNTGNICSILAFFGIPWAVCIKPVVCFAKRFYAFASNFFQPFNVRRVTKRKVKKHKK